MAGERVSARDARARRVEWIVAAVAGGVVVALIAHLVHAALVLEDAPVALRVEVGPAEGGVIPWRVTNAGGRSASSVALVLRQGDGPDRRLVLDYVPAGSAVTGGLPAGPETGPEAGPVTGAIEGWVDP